jgi:hypothetical protein
MIVLIAMGIVATAIVVLILLGLNALSNDTS